MLPADDWQQCGLTDLSDLHTHSHTVCTVTIASQDFLQKWLRIAVKTRTLSKFYCWWSRHSKPQCQLNLKISAVCFQDCSGRYSCQSKKHFFYLLIFRISYSRLRFARDVQLVWSAKFQSTKQNHCKIGYKHWIEQKKLKSESSGIWPRAAVDYNDSSVAVWCRHNNSLAQWIEPRTRQRTDPWMNWIQQGRTRGSMDTITNLRVLMLRDCSKVNCSFGTLHSIWYYKTNARLTFSMTVFAWG